MNRVALVTGGSRGIGRAITRTLHRDGFIVIIHYRSDHEAARALADELGQRAVVASGDLAVSGEPERVWTESIARHGRLDVLINNAGAWLASPWVIKRAGTTAGRPIWPSIFSLRRLYVG